MSANTSNPFEELKKYFELIRFTEDHILMSKRYLDFERNRLKNHPPDELTVRFDFAGDKPCVKWYTDQSGEIKKTFVPFSFK